MILNIHNEYTNKDVEIQAYTSKKYFTENYCIAIQVGRNTYYIPLEEWNEYDSSLRAYIDKTYQVNKSLPANIVNEYFPGGNLLIPMEDFYNVYSGLLGEDYASIRGNKITIKTPPIISGLTKLFICGLNVTISYKNQKYTTYYNGLSNKPYKKNKLFSNIMVVKLLPGYTYELSYSDTYRTYSYSNELIKNFILIGYDVELLNEECWNYNSLYYHDNYHIYKDNEIQRIPKHTFYNQYVSFIKENYFDESHLIYNYYVLKELNYESEVKN
jgi:hypothetical protein